MSVVTTAVGTRQSVLQIDASHGPMRLATTAHEFRLLVAYDGSAEATAAIRSLRYAGLPSRGQAMVVTIADAWLAPTGSQLPLTTPLSLRRECRQARAHALTELLKARLTATKGMRLFRSLYPAWTVRVIVAADSPTRGVLQAARSWKPHLVACGLSGRSALDRFIMKEESVSRGLMQEYPAPIHIGRGSKGTIRRPRILVGFDGSRHAKAAIGALAKRAWPDGSRIRVAAAVDPAFLARMAITQPDLWPKKGIADASGIVRRCASQLSAALGRAQVYVDYIVLLGDPAPALMKEADRWKAELIVVGARGLNRLQRLRLGSVSRRLALRAPCSVQILRPRRRNSNIVRGRPSGARPITVLQEPLGSYTAND